MKPLKAWSYSRYALYQMCPMRFKHEVLEGNKTAESAAMARGQKIHKDIADWLMMKAEGLPKEVIKHPRVEQVMSELFQIKDKQIEQQLGFTDCWKPTGWFAKDTWLRVVLDVGIMYPDLTYEVVDHKTGKRYGSNDDQMELFAVAVMCQFVPVKHVTTRLVYIDSGEEEFAEFPAHHKQRLIDKWVKKIRPMFEDTTWAPRPNDKCRFCPLAKSAGGKCAFG